jgi:succinoglycan biosynthesis protein ExoM
MINSTTTTSVDICIATYKRPELLVKLLESLVVQTIINTIKLKIIIIDNDSEKSAAAIVLNFFADKNDDYIYDVQPEKNIALTRNKALEHANAEYIAFIDDDEWAATDWLETLLQASINYHADVVFGSVIYQLPSDAPSWVHKGGFFTKSTVITGELRQHGASNNTLINNTSKNKLSLMFNPEYGLTGGEDTEMFYRLFLSGAKLISCKEALVYEAVTPERMTVSWLIKRAYRSGQVYAKIFYSAQPTYKKVFFFAKRFAYFCLAFIAFVFSLFMGKAHWVWALRKVVANAGQFSMLFVSKPYQGYK